MRPQPRAALRSALRATALCVSLVAGLLSGCRALLPKLLPPQLTVTSVTVEGGSLRQERLQLNLHVINPNDRRIAVRGLEAHLDVEGKPFATGASDAAFTIPANGATDFVLNVTADMNAGLGVLLAALGHQLVDYRLYGQVHLAHSLVHTINYAHDGRMRL